MTDGRVLVGSVGYRNLRDHSAGVLACERLATRSLGASVVVEDLSYGPIAVIWRLFDEPEGARFDRAILVSAVPRPNRAPGALTAFRWDGALPDEQEIQRCVADAVTGIILLDNTLVVTRYFDALPRDTAVVEVEPVAHEFGDELSAPVAARMDELCQLVERLAIDRAAFEALPVQPLGGRPTQVFA